ncbi:alpha/beta hydrolase [Dactylosporangium darangshiense]|uniref:Peptidase S33 tripeptidyl aminopeptidase-like C-terminal domain-containing protein n=1 Tax=Dactylosporangium darangshiense TaxID=579108 RepID=A0ABP8DRF0_9ACTN
MSATVGAPVVAGARWDPPAAIAVRGTVLLLPGRGEHAGVYDRFGRRLAADGYAVRCATPDTLAELAEDAVPPLVLAGSDTGALHALASSAAVPAAGVIAVGVPWQAPAATGGLEWDAELDARSACPTHRSRLDADAGFERGALTSAVPEALHEAARPALVAVPVLVIHGEADPIAPVQGARALAAALPRAELATVRDGRHDSLNDVAHRMVAAHVVQWLERLRTGAPILTVS